MKTLCATLWDADTTRCAISSAAPKNIYDLNAESWTLWRSHIHRISPRAKCQWGDIRDVSVLASHQCTTAITCCYCNRTHNTEALHSPIFCMLNLTVHSVLLLICQQCSLFLAGYIHVINQCRYESLQAEIAKVRDGIIWTHSKYGVRQSRKPKCDHAWRGC